MEMKLMSELTELNRALRNHNSYNYSISVQVNIYWNTIMNLNCLIAISDGEYREILEERVKYYFNLITNLKTKKYVTISNEVIYNSEHKQYVHSLYENVS